MPSGRIDKYEYFTGEEIGHSDQRRVIEQAKLEDQGKNNQKQLKILENNWLNLMHLLKKMIIVLKIN